MVPQLHVCLYEEDETMSEALMEIMKKDIDKRIGQEILTGIQNLMKDLQMTAQQAMNAMGIDPSKQASYLSML